MSEIDSTIHELDRAFRAMLGAPTGSLKYLRWWHRPLFEVAFEPRGEKHVNVWLEPQCRSAASDRSLSVIDYDPAKSRNSNLARCRRLCKGNPVIRIRCRPADSPNVISVVRECAIAAGVVDLAAG